MAEFTSVSDAWALFSACARLLRVTSAGSRFISDVCGEEGEPWEARGEVVWRRISELLGVCDGSTIRKVGAGRIGNGGLREV